MVNHNCSLPFGDSQLETAVTRVTSTSTHINEYKGIRWPHLNKDENILGTFAK